LQVAGWIAKGLLWFVEAMASIPFASVPLEAAWAVLWVIGASALVLVGLCLGKWQGLRVAASCAALAFALGLAGQTAFMRGVCRVTVTDCGDALSVVMTYRGQTAVLLCDGNAKAVSRAQQQLRLQGHETPDVLIYSKTAEKTAASLAAGESLSADRLDGERAGLWEDIAVSSPAEGWLSLEWGEARLLLACDGAQAARLTDREATVLLFSGLPPKGPAELSVTQAVASCGRENGMYMARQLAAWAFPCAVTGGDGSVTVLLRNNGAVALGQ
jgi:hypothetical protein